VAPDFDDDVIAGACLTHDGVVRHPPTAEALELADRQLKAPENEGVA
jgi:NAD(P) transhydrogenase subunit alpha